MKLDDYRCGCDDHDSADLGRGPRMWGFLDPTWAVESAPPGITVEALASAVSRAMASWSAVCAIRPRRAAPGEPPNLVIRAARIDGRSNVLADCQLPARPSGPDATLLMRLDAAEGWEPGLLLPVLTHELGHWLGLDHLGRGNLMQPSYSESIARPQAGDAREARARYPISATPPPAPAPATLPATLVINGVTYTRKD